MGDPRVILEIGKRGFGKTRGTKLLIAGLPRVIVVDQRGEYGGAPFTDFDAMADYAASRPSFLISWRGGQDLAPAVFHLAFCIKDVYVVLEECDLVPEEGHYYEAIYRGRNPYGIGIIGVSQRPQNIGPALRSQATDVYAYNNSEPSALQWMRPFFGERVGELPQLPKLHGLHYSADETVNVSPFVLPPI